MKNLFDKLKTLMDKYDLYQVGDEVGNALNELETEVNTETRVYLISHEETTFEFDELDLKEITDEDWITESERQGSVYTLEGFTNAFNQSDMFNQHEINQSNDVIRIIKVPVSH